MTDRAETSAQTGVFTIRRMRAGDLDQVTAIDRLSFSLPWPKRAFENDLNDNPNAMLWVAEFTDENAQCIIVGAAVIWIILDEAHIATLAVHPDHRGRGIAKCILYKALAAAIIRGATTATLEVRSSNIVAQDLYTYFQFDVVGRRRKYYMDNQEDALIMTVTGLGEEYLYWLEKSREKQRTAMTDIIHQCRI